MFFSTIEVHDVSVNDACFVHAFRLLEIHAGINKFLSTKYGVLVFAQKFSTFVSKSDISLHFAYEMADRNSKK